PRVVVYVTREEPLTGAEQLLVFDLPAEPAFSSVVPGGRLEPGETAAEAAVRELREETGLEGEVVRGLGAEKQPGWRGAGRRGGAGGGEPGGGGGADGSGARRMGARGRGRRLPLPLDSAFGGHAGLRPARRVPPRARRP